MNKEVDELVESVSNIGKYLIKRIVTAAHEAERTVAPAAPGSVSTAAPAIDFHLGEWRRFSEFGEAYLVVAPLRQVGPDWIMRIHLKDGTQAEYPLSNILRNPPLQGANPLQGADPLQGPGHFVTGVQEVSDEVK